MGGSPDGSVVAITTKNDHEIWLVGGDGKPARKIDETDGSAGFRSVHPMANALLTLGGEYYPTNTRRR